MNSLFARLLAAPLALATFTCCLADEAAVKDPQSTPQKIDFARQVLPILSDKCFVCHGPDGEAKEELRLDSFDEATKDLGDRRAIDPQHPEQSELLLRIHSEDDPMPPEDAEKQLTDRERDVLSRWIREGGAYATHWAFVPPIKATIDGKPLDSTRAAIDAFVQSGLKDAGVEFAPEADRATLARRAALVLTGLPPEPNQLQAFLDDKREDAYERFVDQLLANPHFGEHQARYWLDAVRYGDTHGLHLDNRRGIYPYRDWVIQAFNRNMPIDQFITWQLAGDLLPDPTLEQLVATGYVRMNPTTAEGGAIPAEFQAKNNFDRVETLGTVFLGMTLTCARCHTHKYDPVPQTEYYQLMAFFNSTAESSMDGNKYDYKPSIKAPSDIESWQQWKQLTAARRDLLNEADAELSQRDETDDDEPDDKAQQQLRIQWKTVSSAERLQMLAKPKGLFADSPLQPQAAELLDRFAESEKTYTTTLIAKDLAKPRPTHVLERGEYNLPTGEPLQPGTIKVMGPYPEDAPRNRLGLARWLTSRQHPLVARVLVNRIWQRTFGEGLVRTPEDFGLQGEQPTHPELLDWLAVELHDSRWNLKAMLRAMVTSRTFKQRSTRRSDLTDPKNRLFARGPSHRLDAEVIRDVGLWASRLLDPAMGGEGVKPYQPKGLWSALMHPASNTKNYVRDKGPRLYRRSLYVYWKRTSPHPMMTLFDAPSRESSCVRRSRTNTSLQSLGLLNETQRVEIARKLAARLLNERDNDDARLQLLFTLLASRPPTNVERDACLGLVATMKKRYSTDLDAANALLSHGDAPPDENLDPAEQAAWTQLAITVLASDIAITLY